MVPFLDDKINENGCKKCQKVLKLFDEKKKYEISTVKYEEGN